MGKNFHRDYAESVGHFCQSIPAQLGITAQEIDAYFRSCALCLWSAGGGLGGEAALTAADFKMQRFILRSVKPAAKFFFRICFQKRRAAFHARHKIRFFTHSHFSSLHVLIIAFSIRNGNRKTHDRA